MEGQNVLNVWHATPITKAKKKKKKIALKKYIKKTTMCLITYDYGKLMFYQCLHGAKTSFYFKKTNKKKQKKTQLNVANS